MSLVRIQSPRPKKPGCLGCLRCLGCVGATQKRARETEPFCFPIFVFSRARLLRGRCRAAPSAGFGDWCGLIDGAEIEARAESPSAPRQVYDRTQMSAAGRRNIWKCIVDEKIPVVQQVQAADRTQTLLITGGPPIETARTARAAAMPLPRPEMIDREFAGKSCFAQMPR